MGPMIHCYYFALNFKLSFKGIKNEEKFLFKFTHIFPLLSCFLPLSKSKFLFGIILLLHVEFLLTFPKVQVYKWLIPVLLVSNNLNFSWTFEHSIAGKRIVGRRFVFCLFGFFLVLQRYCSIVFEPSLFMMRSLLKFFSLMDTALLPLATFNVFFFITIF